MSHSEAPSGQSNEQMPEFENIITIDMLDERVADINRLITSANRLLPRTVDASMVKSDEFLKLLNTFLEQKLLLTRKCVEMSRFMEDLHALTALTLTPALMLLITVLIVLYSENYLPSIPIISTRIIPNVSAEMKPFIYFCFVPFPLYLYFSYVFIMSKIRLIAGRDKVSAECANFKDDPITTMMASVHPNLKGWSGRFDKLVLEVYPKLKGYSELFRNTKRRTEFLFRAWVGTGFVCSLLLAFNLKIESFFVRVFGLSIVGGVNFLTGFLLCRFTNFSNSVREFYSPIEILVIIISFSPICYTVLGTVAALFVPVVTAQVDFDQVREKSTIAIHIAEEKLRGILAVRAGMRNVRVTVTTHVQSLAEGLLQRKIDTKAGMAIATEGTKVTKKVIKWTGNKIMERLSSPEPEFQSNAL